MAFWAKIGGDVLLANEVSMIRLKFFQYLLRGAPIYFPGLDLITREKRNRAVMTHFEALDCPVYYVLGNHELKLKNGIDAMNDYHDYRQWFAAFKHNYYYSWDTAGYHFVALNSNENYAPVLTEIFSPKILTGGCFTFSEEQLAWLRDDLANTDKPTVIFTHIPLDNRSLSSYDIVNNAKDVRRILYQSKKVVAVIQGHSHHMSAPSLVGYTARFKGIPYVYLPSFGSKVVGPRYSHVTVNLAREKLIVDTYKAGQAWHRQRKIPIPSEDLGFDAREPITFSVINDIHYGPQRWDLYTEPENVTLLNHYISATNQDTTQFVVVNGDWIDGHM